MSLLNRFTGADVERHKGKRRNSGVLNVGSVITAGAFLFNIAPYIFGNTETTRTNTNPTPNPKSTYVSQPNNYQEQDCTKDIDLKIKRHGKIENLKAIVEYQDGSNKEYSLKIIGLDTAGPLVIPSDAKKVTFKGDLYSLCKDEKGKYQKIEYVVLSILIKEKKYQKDVDTNPYLDEKEIQKIQEIGNSDIATVIKEFYIKANKADEPDKAESVRVPLVIAQPGKAYIDCTNLFNILNQYITEDKGNTQKIIEELDTLLNKLGGVNLEELVNDINLIKQSIQNMQEVKKKEQEPTKIEPKPKRGAYIIPAYGSDGASIALLGDLHRSKDFGLLLGLAYSNGIKNKSFDPQRVQDDRWYSNEFGQWVHSTSDLFAKYIPQQLELLLGAEFGKQNGFRVGIEGRAGVQSTPISYALQKIIECMDDGNILENRIIDLGKESYYNFILKALGYVKIPLVKDHLDLYASAGAQWLPDIIVDKINGQALMTSVKYKGKIEPVVKAGLNVRLF